MRVGVELEEKLRRLNMWIAELSVFSPAGTRAKGGDIQLI